jgi:hypothetical protein
MSAMRPLRVGLPPLPATMRSRPINSQAFPVPWFAEHPERITDISGAQRVRALKERRCWTCGRRLGAKFSFVLGPNETLIRLTLEAPSHYRCAVFTVGACPYLRNPDRSGVVAVWTCRDYGLSKTGIVPDEPVAVRWFSRGVPADREQVRCALELSRDDADPSLFYRALELLPSSPGPDVPDCMEIDAN